MPAIVDVPLVRRLVIPLLSIPIAGLLFHAQLSDGLVIRGDGEFQAGDMRGANKFYQRARWFDGDSSAAAERITTLGIMSHSATYIHSALAVADYELAHQPGDTIVRQNRAILLQKIGQGDRAYADFRLIALQTKNPAIVEYAARDAERHHQYQIARRFYARALQIDPTLASARAAIARLDGRLQ